MTDHADHAPATPADEFTRWLTASCQRQGIAVTVSDPMTITNVTALLGVTSATARARHRHPQSDIYDIAA